MRTIHVEENIIKDFDLLMKEYNLGAIEKAEFDYDNKILTIEYAKTGEAFRACHTKTMRVGDKIVIVAKLGKQLLLEEAELIVDTQGKYAIKSENFDLNQGIITYYWFQLEGGNENEIYG